MIKFVNVQSEYDKDKQLKPDDVKSLLDWAEKQPHLPEINEVQAILFLQSCYYSNELAKTTIDIYFTVRTLCPEMLLMRNPLKSPLKEALNVTHYSVLPKQTPEGYTIIMMQFIDENPDNFNFNLCLKHFDMVVSSYLHKYGTSKGHLILVEMKGVSFGHVTKLGPLTLKKFFYYLQEAMPLRLKGLHYVHAGPVLDKIMALAKPFMKKELIEMLHFHTDVNSVLPYIPKECLPEDYGGDLEHSRVFYERTNKQLFDDVEFFEWEDKQLVDENKRPGKPKNISDVFGVEGTFKKLELD